MFWLAFGARLFASSLQVGRPLNLIDHGSTNIADHLFLARRFMASNGAPAKATLGASKMEPRGCENGAPEAPTSSPGGLRDPPGPELRLRSLLRCLLERLWGPSGAKQDFIGCLLGAPLARKVDSLQAPQGTGAPPRASGEPPRKHLGALLPACC